MAHHRADPREQTPEADLLAQQAALDPTLIADEHDTLDQADRAPAAAWCDEADRRAQQLPVPAEDKYRHEDAGDRFGAG